MLRKCKVCKGEFYVKPFHFRKGWSRCCSLRCRAEAQRTAKKVHCKYCGKDVVRQRSALRKNHGKAFCNRSCACSWKNQFRRGSNHPSYKGGVEYREKAFKHYGRECQNQGCEIRKAGIHVDVEMLEIHHINGKRKDNRIRNLRVLCVWCHKKETIKARLRGRAARHSSAKAATPVQLGS